MIDNVRDLILVGDVRSQLRRCPDKSVHLCVSSPPYWGLRSYGTVPQVWGGGAEGCRHEFNVETTGKKISGGVGTFGNVANFNDKRAHLSSVGKFCWMCGAWLGELGCEPNPKLFVEHIVEIYAEMWRVLRDDGVLYLNFGDSYASNSSNQNGRGDYGSTINSVRWYSNGDAELGRHNKIVAGLKPKDLVGIPWRVAFALQDAGWYLRSDIIWRKPNPIPESVTDRPTRSHEYVFLLSKSERYYWDAEAVKEPVSESFRNDNRHRYGATIRSGVEYGKDYKQHKAQVPKSIHSLFMKGHVPLTRNIRSVWTIPTQAFAGSHFATFPDRLAELCIKSGSSEYGCCSKCGKQWERILEKHLVKTVKAVANGSVVDDRDLIADKNDQGSNRQKSGHKPGYVNSNDTIGWLPMCDCGGYTVRDVSRKKYRWKGNFYLDRWKLRVEDKFPAVVPSIVMDTFAGSGTTLEVAKKLGRCYVGIELNEKYVNEILLPRLHRTTADVNVVGDPEKEDQREMVTEVKQLSLF